jgi:transcription elongation GreA/GreB family factor
MRYFAERLRTARLMPDPVERDTVAFGSRMTFARDDGRRQTFRIVGEDEADPRAGSLSYVSPVARALIGKVVGDRVILGDHEIEVLAVE